jgi:hypothetical protein
MDETNESSHEDSSAILEEYKQVKEKYKKTLFCYYYWRQRCFFTKERCKYAHGITDLKRYPREEFLQIKKSFYILKGKVHNKPNPEGIDPHPKQAKVDDIDFSSDDEEAQIFRAKRRARSKEEYAKVKDWQQEILVEFALYLFEERKEDYIQRELFEKLFEDVKLKYDSKVLTGIKKIVHQKLGVLLPSEKIRKHIFIKYPRLEHIIEPLSDHIGKMVGVLKKSYVFPVYYAEFERVYHEDLPILLPDIKLLHDLLNANTNIEFISALESNEKIMKKIKDYTGEEEFKEGILIDDYFSPIDKEKLIKRVQNIWIGCYDSMRNICTEMCSITFQYFVSKEKPIKSLMEAISFKQIITGTGIYFVRSHGNSIVFEALMTNITQPCIFKSKESNSGKEEVRSEKIKEEHKQLNIRNDLIDGKILWVTDLSTLNEAIEITKNAKQIAVDLEGSLSVFYTFIS